MPKKANVDLIANKDQALDLSLKINLMPRAGWLKKGSRAKSNETIEISRALAKELVDKTVYYYQVLELLPGDPFCNCKQIEALLLKAVEELPDGDTVDELQQVTFTHCPVCGKKFEES